MKVLIADDEPLEREVLTRIIKTERLGITQITEAENGLEAVEQARTAQVDLVLMAVELPVMDGLTAAGLIRADLPDCRVVFLTAMEEAGLETRCEEWLYKPAHPRELVQVLARQLPAAAHAPLPVLEAAKAEPVSRNQEVMKVMAYIRANVGLDLKLEALAELVHFNGQYLSRLFKQETGSTLTQFITSCRLERAKHYLSYGSDTVVEISRRCGFVDANYFARVFKKHEGVTPTQYQEQAHLNRKKRINTYGNFVM